MTATSDAGSKVGYTLDNQWRAARERLTLLEAACDPITERHLDVLGVGAGWRCLEVGAGAGSVTRMLCERVGEDGSVVAVDLQPVLLADLAAPNLEVRRVDVVAEDLPEAAFDFVHTRAVLLHLAQREEVIGKLVRALRPGGVLLLEEMDLSPVIASEDIVGRAVRSVYRSMIEAGVDFSWAGTMPQLLKPAGLVDVEWVSERATFTGGSALARFYSVTCQQLLETQAYSDAEKAELATNAAALLEPGGPYVAWDFVAAWGRHP